MAPDLGASKLVARGRVVQPRRWCALRCTSSCIALPPAGADAVRPTWEDGEVDRYSEYDIATDIVTSTTPATYIAIIAIIMVASWWLLCMKFLRHEAVHSRGPAEKGHLIRVKITMSICISM